MKYVKNTRVIYKYDLQYDAGRVLFEEREIKGGRKDLKMVNLSW